MSARTPTSSSADRSPPTPPDLLQSLLPLGQSPEHLRPPAGTLREKRQAGAHRGGPPSESREL
eukprot:4157084-Alexandrium_andersonii.AAC.1